VQALIDFCKRNSNILLFIILQIICIRIIITGKTNISKSLINSSNKVVGTIYQKKQDVSEYFFLKESNDSLLAENARLRYKLMQEIKDIPITDSNGTITYKKDSVTKNIRYHYFAAKVIQNSFDEPNNYLTIDKGKYNGIKIGMAVLSNNSIVGKVVNVSEHFAVVKSIISQRFRVSARISDGTIGYITWPDFDSKFAQLNDMSQNIKVKMGDSVFTTGYSMFPPDVLIGRIAQATATSEGFNLKVYLTTNFRRLNYVYVVEDISEQEITAVLDTAIIKDQIKKPK
jgi:rod shape-determining protein MreC